MTFSYILALVALICTFVLAFNLGISSPVTVGMMTLDTFGIWCILFWDGQSCDMES